MLVYSQSGVQKVRPQGVDWTGSSFAKKKGPGGSQWTLSGTWVSSVALDDRQTVAWVVALTVGGQWLEGAVKH